MDISKADRFDLTGKAFKFVTVSNALLNHINSPEDLRKLRPEELPRLAQELREFIIAVVATKRGHLGASLGVVELTLALHYFFDTPKDQLVWDVGHQAYGHKIITGRREQFDTNRQLHGISGFPRRDESVYDTFGVGHSSTSISAALGMAIAAKLQGKQQEHIAIIGDAAIASGMAFEGLNHAGVSKTNLWIILNDNAMGIDPSVGALKDYLSQSTIEKTPSQDTIFEALNSHYEGPIDGHNIGQILATFEKLKAVEGPKLIHLITTKGKGLKTAEEDQVTFHAPGKFNKDTGELLPVDQHHLPPKFQDVFGLSLVELAQDNSKIIGITPAMPTGSSLKYMMAAFPERALDVGIAEQHAVTLSAGMVTQGSIVFCAIYSTFLQRAYDQIIHDVALQNLPVIFCIDRAGLVGEDGATHHGVFDIAYLRNIPNMLLAAPSDEIDLRNLLYTASLGLTQPIAIRYPRGRGNIIDWQRPFKKLEIGKGNCVKKGHKIAVLSVGPLKTNVAKAIDALNQPEFVAHYAMRFIKPLDTTLLQEVFAQFERIITIEDGVIIGGFGDAVINYANAEHYRGQLEKLGIPDRFIEHGTTEELQDIAGISVGKIRRTLEKHLSQLA